MIASTGCSSARSWKAPISTVACCNPKRQTRKFTSANAANGIFSLLKKEYDAPRKRALAATARLKQMPAMLAQGERNLQKPVKLFAQLTIASARAIDPLFNDSLMTLARDLA